MGRTNNNKRTLFDTKERENISETYTLNRAILLERLHRCKEANTTQAARQVIQDICDMLNAPNSTLLHHNGDMTNSVQFCTTFLHNALDQIREARTLERASYYVERLIKGITETKTSAINDINLNRWQEYEHIYTDSLWIEPRRDNSGVHAAGYWGNFIPQIPHQMMLRYTKQGEWVLDTFAGSGTTIIEGQRLGRHTIGVELQPNIIVQAKQHIDAEPNPYDVVCDIAHGDSTTLDYAALLQHYGCQQVQLVMMHPPYFDIIKFSDDARDLSNAATLDDFVAKMSKLVEHVTPVLERGRYLALVIGDTYANGEWIPLGFYTMQMVLQHGFTLKSIIVKNFEETTGKRNQKELWRYRALVGGFYIFKHEYVFVFQKGRR